jgi:tetratricopeptide (TPR) repeat protein
MMLETVREFALEQLEASGERGSLQLALAAYALVLAEEVALHKSPAQLAEWLSACDDERDNMRAALAFLVETANAPWALRLGVALYRYWELGEYFVEGRACLEAVLELPAGAARTAGRARALNYAAALANSQGDHQTAFARLREALEIARELGDRKGVINPLNALAATSRFLGDYASALEWSERTLEACREAGDTEAIAAALSNLADVVLRLGRYDDAEQLLHQSLALFAELGDENGVAWCCNHLGDVAAASGQRGEARRLYERGATIFTSTGNGWALRDRCAISGTLRATTATSNRRAQRFARRWRSSRSFATNEASRPPWKGSRASRWIWDSPAVRSRSRLQQPRSNVPRAASDAGSTNRGWSASANWRPDADMGSADAHRRIGSGMTFDDAIVRAHDAGDDASVEVRGIHSRRTASTRSTADPPSGRAPR